MAIGDKLTLAVERMAYGADAVARDADGRTVFVTGGVPGDTVEAVVEAEAERYANARVQKVLEASPDRVQPACPYAAVCGGCPWSAMSYEAQARAKRAGVVDALARIGRFGTERAEALVRPLESPSAPWGYRNKVELAAVQKNGRLVLGMHAAGGAGVVKVDRCALLSKKHTKDVKALTGAVGYLANSHGLEIERVGIRASEATEIGRAHV